MTNADLIEEAKAKMTLKKYRTCGSCRAHTWDSKCELGFAVNRKYVNQIGYARITPAEPCYKPLTYPQLCAAMDMRRLLD